MLDRLGVTEPPKAQNGINLGVQVVLNGGAVPAELGLSPVEKSLPGETLALQAGNSDVNITALIGPDQTSTQPMHAQGLTATGADAMGSQVISTTEAEGSRL